MTINETVENEDRSEFVGAIVFVVLWLLLLFGIIGLMGGCVYELNKAEDKRRERALNPKKKETIKSDSSIVIVFGNKDMEVNVEQ